MQIIHPIKDMHSLRKLLRVSDKSIGFVPTMGALHEGHLSLIKRSKKENDITVVSIYINPMQFGPDEDLQKYPRKREKDIEMLSSLEVDTVFIPDNDEMYGEDTSTFIYIGKLAKILCGASRPGHFDGVATIVAKLFNIVDPDRAYFGQKDFQQSAVIKKMVRKLNYGIDIIVCPTVREDDGLAMSSRNSYLTADEREAAPALYRALKRGKDMILEEKIDDAFGIRGELETMLNAAPLLDLEYIDIMEPDGLRTLTKIELPVLICVSAKIGQTRLIDNIIIDEGSVSPDDCAI